MTKEEFIGGYCQRSEISLEEFNRFFVALPCACGDSLCNGWASICNNELSIKTHKELYQ